GGFNSRASAPQVGQSALGSGQLHFIDVAPGPTLPWLVGCNDRVACVLEMLGRVAPRRAVATADVTAAQTEAEMDPGRAEPEALLTSPAARGNALEIGQVWTSHR